MPRLAGGPREVLAAVPWLGCEQVLCTGSQLHLEHLQDNEAGENPTEEKWPLVIAAL